MSLIKDYFQPQFEIAIPNCYWKIELSNGINGGKEKLHVRLNCFKNKEIADTNKNKYCDFDFQFSPSIATDAPNVFTQAYAYVKTLPEFSTAVDA